MAYPVLAAQNTWWKPNVATVTRASITEIEIMDSYTPDSSVTVVDSWDASAAKDGSITCYAIGTKLIIAGNGSGKIAANEDSQMTFAFFTNATRMLVNLLDVSKATTMMGMFGYSKILTLDLSNWNMSKVTDVNMMFSSCTALTSVNLSNWDVSQVVNMYSMFNACSSLTALDLSSWQVLNVTNLEQMFYKCNNLTTLNLSGWNTSKVTSLKGLCGYCQKLTTIIGIDQWDVSNVESMYLSFYNCHLLNSIGNLENWDVSKVTDMGMLFAFCKQLESVGDLSRWDVSNVVNMEGSFGMCQALTFIGDLSNWNVSKVTKMNSMFELDAALVTLGDLSQWDVSNVTTMSAMFNGCSSLASLGDLSQWDITNVNNLNAMFYDCHSLISLGTLSNWNTANVTNMHGLFNDCSKLSGLDISNWNLSSCTDMSFMFRGASSIKEIDVSKWDVSKVQSFDHFAAHAGLRRKGIENWKTTSLINANAAFHNCAEEELDLSGWDVSKVQIFDQMFENSPKLKYIKGLDKWDTSAGLGFSGMFERCYALEEVDLSSFNTSKAKNDVVASTNGGTTGTLGNMFYSCNNLKKITLGPNFAINGDGTNTSAANKLILPTPDPAYIDGADGQWYTFNGDSYTPTGIPDRTANTYYSSRSTVYDADVIVKNGSLIDAARAIREKNGATTNYTPAQFGAAIRAL